MKPLLSLIIPYYNHAALLPRLLRSAAAQSIAGEMEVILVDDASDTPCTGMEAVFPELRMRIIRLSERVYTKNARLYGIAAAQGEVIAFADADDTLWGTDALEKNARLLLDQEADIVHFPCVAVNADLLYVREYKASRPLAPVLEGRAIFASLVRNRVRGSTIWSKLYSRRLAQVISEPARNIRVRHGREDVALTLFFFLHAHRYVASPHIGYGHHDVNRNQAKAWSRAAACWYMLQDILPHLEAQGCLPGEIETIQRGLQRFKHKNMCLLYRNIADEYPRISDACINDLLQHADFESAAYMLCE